jgi:predicted NUDIX family NTP pyrophosphohydrolase
MYRTDGSGLSILLVHPGGPFWRNKDAGAWSIPKGEIGEGEDAAAAARREFEEELGTAPPGELIPLGQIRQKGGKVVEAFALEGDLDTRRIVSNSFDCEWPPRSGRIQSFPEVDRAEWFTIAAAREKLLESQWPLLHRLAQALGLPGSAAPVVCRPEQAEKGE